MQLKTTLMATSILAIFISSPLWAADAGHTSEAMEHAGKAQAHGEVGHAKESVSYTHLTLPTKLEV